MDGEGSAVNTLTFFLLPFLLFSLHAVLGIFFVELLVGLFTGLERDPRV
jgi:hypothetical protein